MSLPSSVFRLNRSRTTRNHRPFSFGSGGGGGVFPGGGRISGSPERGGRRRKYFKLEAHGKQALRESLAVLRRMTAGIEADLPGGGLS